MITAPEKRLTASMSTSMVSRSRWFVGSSSTTRCGGSHASSQKATRLFCPPESVRILRKAPPSTMPNVASFARASRSLVPGNLCRMCSSADLLRSSWSTWCCAKQTTRAIRFSDASPESTGSSPVIARSSVVLPAPLAPRMPMRLFSCTCTLTPRISGAWPLYPISARSSCTSCAFLSGGGVGNSSLMRAKPVSLSGSSSSPFSSILRSIVSRDLTCASAEGVRLVFLFSAAVFLDVSNLSIIVIRCATSACCASYARLAPTYSSPCTRTNVDTSPR
mmetsp:Transcript_5711/g.14917  ORF Transcript_5711/g.14917 Transcript_5711/m.14917 type:complete len:277 (+) Transcript_5711:445-1275(+)